MLLVHPWRHIKIIWIHIWGSKLYRLVWGFMLLVHPSRNITLQGKRRSLWPYMKTHTSQLKIVPKYASPMDVGWVLSFAAEKNDFTEMCVFFLCRFRSWRASTSKSPRDNLWVWLDRPVVARVQWCLSFSVSMTHRRVRCGEVVKWSCEWGFRVGFGMRRAYESLVTYTTVDGRNPAPVER